MQYETSAKISAEMSKILESMSEYYSDEIRNYISNGRIFSNIDNRIISNMWIELALSKNSDLPDSNNTRTYIEIEHLLRGLALPYDRLIENGGNVFSILGSTNDGKFIFSDNDIGSYADIDENLDSMHKKYIFDKKNHN